MTGASLAPARAATQAGHGGARRWPALDGLRGVAVLMVVVDHAGLAGERRPLGAVGVTVFFVLSGFLISHVVLRARREGTWSVRTFLGARFVRLVPALVVVQVATILWWASGGRPWDVLWPEVVASTLYVSNFLFGQMEPGLLRHTWSLGVEEQFYLLWPLLLPWVVRRPAPLRWMTALVLASIVFRLGAAADGHVGTAYASLPANAYALLLGCALAVDPAVVRSGRGQRGVAVTGLALVVVGALLLDVPAPFILLPVPAALVAAVVVACSLPGVPLLEVAPLRFLGRISYAVYLWHWPLLALTGQQYSGPSALPVLLLVLVVATVSTIALEEPLRRRAWRPRQDSNLQPTD